MAKIKIIINGVEYPSYFTLGAGLIFKQETGKDVSKLDIGDLVELGTLLYAQCKAAARREKKDFPYSLEDFLDQITDEDLYALGNDRNQKEETTKKKGKPRQ